MSRPAALLAAAVFAAACSSSPPAAANPAAVPAVTAAATWSMFRGDSARDGHPVGASLGPAAAARLALAWQTDLHSPIVGSPVVAGAAVVVGTLGGTLEALGTERGDKLWAVSGLGPLAGQPLIFEDKVFVGSTDGHLYAVELHSGTRIWDWRAPGVQPVIWGGPAVHRGLLLLGIGSQADGPAPDAGRLVALDPASGDRFWATCLLPGCAPGDAVSSSIAIAPDGTGYVAVGAPDSALVAVDVGIGRIRWRRSLVSGAGPGPDVSATPVLLRSHGRVRVAAAGPLGRFAVLDGAAGTVVWSRDLRSGATPASTLAGSPAFDGQRLYVPLSGSPGGLVALRPDDGLLTWRHSSERSVSSSPAVGRDVVVFGEGAAAGDDAGGAVVAVAAGDGHELWRHETRSAVVASPAIVGDAVYVADRQGVVLAFRPAA